MQDELLDHLHDHLARQRREADDGVQPVAELGREGALDRLAVLALAPVAAEADRRAGLVGGARVRGHDEDHVAEIDLLAVVVGELAVVHHLQKDVEDVRVRLFNLVEQQDAVRMLVHAVGQKPPLVEADIAGRRADQAADRVLFHVFRHVEAQHLDAERACQLLGDLGLADAGRTREQVVADRLFRLAQTGARKLDRRGQRLDRLVLPEHQPLERLFKVAQHLGVVLADAFRRDPGDLGDDRLDLLGADGLAALAFRHEVLGRARLVDHVDRAVGQLAVVDVARGKLHRRADRVRGVAHVVMLFEAGLQPHQDLDRVGHVRFVHVDLLEPAAERAVLFKVLAELLVGRGPHAAQLAARERGLQQVRRVHRAAAGRAGADDGVDLVDEKDRVVVILELLHDGLQPLLEVAAIAGAREQRAHVEREDRGAREDLGRLAPRDLEREPLGDGGLADARIAHQQRVVLAAAAQHLDAALDLVGAADQRVHVALLRLFVQVHAVFRQRGFVLAGLGARRLGLRFLVGALHVPGFREGRVLGHAVGDEVDGVVARHLQFLQEEGGVGFAFGEDRDQHVRARDLGPARRLDVDRRALDHALERGRGNRFRAVHVGHQRRQVVVDIVGQHPPQFVQIDVARLHDGDGVRFLGQREKEMFEGGQFMAVLVCQRQRGMNGLFQGRGEGGHGQAPVSRLAVWATQGCGPPVRLSSYG